MKKQELPKGWTQEEISKLAKRHDSLTEVEQAAEIEAAVSKEGYTMIAVPTKLVPKVAKLIAKSQPAF